jgi:hypothetical protein
LWEFLGKNDLVAFVVTYGLPSIPLEIAPDSTAKVEVVDACIPDTPAGSVGAPGAPGAPGASGAGGSPTRTLTQMVAQSQPPTSCGHGTVTIRQEKHVTYTSPRDNPVQHDLVDTATISFDLIPDDSDPFRLVSSHSSITWNYSLKSVETGDDCTTVETYEGSGSWEADSEGPEVLLGWGSPNGTIFDMTPDPTRYILQAFAPPNPYADGDPRGWTHGQSDVCGVFTFTGGAPYSSLALVDGPLPAGGYGTFSGSSTKEIQAIDATNQPTTLTVTWSFNVDPPPPG